MRIQREEIIPGKEQTIGIDIELDGSFYNTEIVNGKIQLSYADKNTQEFYPTGNWTSLVVDIGDNFHSYKNVIVTHVNTDGSLIKIYTRTSDDGVSFNGYVELENNGAIKSEIKRYIQIKVDFTANVKREKTELLPSGDMYNSEWIELKGASTVLKNNRNFEMVKDDLWANEGMLYSKQIIRKNWSRIDMIDLEVE